MLAANAGSSVSAEQLIDELWPFGPPRTVRTTVQTYIYQLRKVLNDRPRPGTEDDLLITRPDGYILDVPRQNVDIFEFQRLVDLGRGALRQERPSCAAEILHNALELWRGPMPVDIASGPSLHGLAVLLDERHLEALSLRIEADLANDRHREIVGELRSLVATHRLHEPFHVCLMHALHRSGRRGEALGVYHELRHILDEELGLEPSPEAQELQHKILVSR
jgi:SARP family transcriptional regulator, regulator of embCAB operon